MPPVIDGLGNGHAVVQPDGGVTRRVVGGRKCHDALVPSRGSGFGQPVGNQHPGLAGDVQADKRHIQQQAWVGQVVKQGAVTEHAVRLDVDASRVDAAERHAAGGTRITAVDDAGNGGAVAFSHKRLPCAVEHICREQALATVDTAINCA